jgi:hypothetical protein
VLYKHLQEQREADGVESWEEMALERLRVSLAKKIAEMFASGKIKRPRKSGPNDIEPYFEGGNMDRSSGRGASSAPNTGYSNCKCVILVHHFYLCDNDNFSSRCK